MFLIAGPCVVESEALAIDTAGTLKEICAGLGVPFIYKSSFDKANRSSTGGFRGPGMEEGLRILAEVKRQVGVPVLTDVHEDTPMDEVAAVVDVLQTPAFLCRQTNFILRVASAGKPVNIKKGQFLSPWEMENVVDKAQVDRQRATSWSASAASPSATTTWSPTCAASPIMRGTGCPVVFDATHSVQLPGGTGHVVAAASASSFRCWRARRWRPASPACSWKRIRTRPGAVSDGPNAWPLDKMAALLETLVALDATVKRDGFLEAEYGLGVPHSE